MEAEGWYQDPFGLHEDRWFSVGAPTALVRDGGTEGRDAPPSATFDGQLVPSAEASPVGNGGDLRRADSLTRVDQGMPGGGGWLRIALGNANTFALPQVSDVRDEDRR